MDAARFDRLVIRLAAASSRRTLVLLLAAIPGLVALPDASEAGKRAGGRKGGKRHGRNRPRRRHARRRKHKQKHKKNKNTPPAGCGPDRIDVDEVCQSCTVTCTGEPAACGAGLQAAIDAGSAEPIVVCPGRYGGNFIIPGDATVLGAGDGDDPASSAILDAQGTGRPLTLPFGSNGVVSLTGLRLTGGGGPNGNGGGVSKAKDKTLTMTRCTVSDNHSTNPGLGGGIYCHGQLTLVDCRIEHNTASQAGGGIALVGAGSDFSLTGNTVVRGNSAGFRGGGIYILTGSLAIDASCRVTGNTAPANFGGGIYVDQMSASTEVTLASDQIVTNNTGGNCAGDPIANCIG